MTISQRQLFLKHVGQTSDTPLSIEIERAEGIYLYTPGGEKYIDLVSGVSVSGLGHGHPAITNAVKQQVDKHMHLMVYGEFIQSPQTAYAKWIADHLPEQLNSVYFVNSGSEAIEGAMKLAKRVTGRPEIIAFKNAYHGSTHGALSILGDPGYHSGYLPLLPAIKHIEFNHPDDLEAISSNTAAVVVEPIQAEAGIIEPENGYLQLLREKCDAMGAMLVMDEIQTGFSRTGKRFAFEHYEVVPDIICFAKSFGGGMPLGAFVSNRDHMHTLTHNPSLGHITTFGGHPVSCAAGLAAQRFIEENNLLDHINAMEKRYRDLLVHEGIDCIRGKGLFLSVVFNEKINGVKLMEQLLQQRLIVDQFLFCCEAFRIAPPFIISEDEVRDTASRVLEAFDQSMA